MTSKQAQSFENLKNAFAASYVGHFLEEAIEEAIPTLKKIAKSGKELEALPLIPKMHSSGLHAPLYILGLKAIPKTRGVWMANVSLGREIIDPVEFLAAL